MGRQVVVPQYVIVSQTHSENRAQLARFSHIGHWAQAGRYIMDKKDEKETPTEQAGSRSRQTLRSREAQQEDFDTLIQKSRELIKRVDSYLSRDKSDEGPQR